jgi:hypothetical protein
VNILFHCIHPLAPFPTPPPTSVNPLPQNLFYPPVLQLCRRKEIKDEMKSVMIRKLLKNYLLSWI